MKAYAFFLLLVLASCGTPAEPIIEGVSITPSMEQEPVEEPGSGAIDFTTKDNFVIKGTYYPGTTQGVILLHMLGKDRNSWKELPDTLHAEGYAVLAIDLRGHGESIQDTYDYKAFLSVDYQNMLLDVAGAKQFLLKKGLTEVSIVGASIGANLALAYAAKDPDIKNIVLLSPGENYRGIETFVANEQYQGKMLLVASQEDIQSYAATTQLSKRANGEHIFHAYTDAGHGTDMLKKPDLIPTIVKWIKG